jgi:hypothetical protein
MNGLKNYAASSLEEQAFFASGTTSKDRIFLKNYFKK